MWYLSKFLVASLLVATVYPCSFCLYGDDDGDNIEYEVENIIPIVVEEQPVVLPDEAIITIVSSVFSSLFHESFLDNEDLRYVSIMTKSHVGATLSNEILVGVFEKFRESAILAFENGDEETRPNFLLDYIDSCLFTIDIFQGTLDNDLIRAIISGEGMFEKLSAIGDEVKGSYALRYLVSRVEDERDWEFTYDFIPFRCLVEYILQEHVVPPNIVKEWIAIASKEFPDLMIDLLNQTVVQIPIDLVLEDLLPNQIHSLFRFQKVLPFIEHDTGMLDEAMEMALDVRNLEIVELILGQVQFTTTLRSVEIAEFLMDSDRIDLLEKVVNVSSPFRLRSVFEAVVAADNLQAFEIFVSYGYLTEDAFTRLLESLESSTECLKFVFRSDFVTMTEDQARRLAWASILKGRDFVSEILSLETFEDRFEDGALPFSVSVDVFQGLSDERKVAVLHQLFNSMGFTTDALLEYLPNAKNLVLIDFILRSIHLDRENVRYILSLDFSDEIWEGLFTILLERQPEIVRPIACRMLRNITNEARRDFLEQQPIFPTCNIL